MEIPEIRKCECGGEMLPMMSLSENIIGMQCSDCDKVIFGGHNPVNDAINELVSYLEQNNVTVKNVED